MAKWTPSPNFLPGDTEMGSALVDTHQLTGSVTITGSLSVNGSAIVGGGGDVTGPAGATDNAIARFDTATGKLIKDSGVIVDSLGALSASVLTSSALVSSGDIYLRPSERVWITGSAASSDAVQLFIQNKHSNYSNICIQNQTNIGPASTHGLIMGNNSHKGQIRMMSDGGSNTTLTLGVENTEYIFMDTDGNVVLTENITLGNSSTDYHQVSGTLDVSGTVKANMMSTTILTETINTDTEADCSSYNIFKYTIDATLDITGSNPVAGASYLFILTQGAGAPYTVAWDGFKWPNGGTLPVLSLVAGEIDVVSGISDGTYIYADITKNFS
ncbi:TPA: hypothetical protein EYN09_01195 [Candidatus Poribacteria bacterium]|nr:hypothetical protein [Candidatus Poribacteria bacterium]